MKLLRMHYNLVMDLLLLAKGAKMKYFYRQPNEICLTSPDHK